MKSAALILLLVFTLLTHAQNDVVYHVFQRSFFDSGSDGHGDLKGINQKLDYLQDLGVTTILLTPLYRSEFYHNYFADDFWEIDPEYGTLQDYVQLVREVHRRKMKIYQDVEIQYVSGRHTWFKDSFKNPASTFSEFLVYHDKENTSPFWFFNVPEFTMYNGMKEQIITVNMRSKAVRDYTYNVLAFWIDPNKDGKFDDGVDGFRLDHMMDDLDNAGKLTNLFAEFWTPLLSDLKSLNPKIKIVAEQANWGSYGHDYFEKAGVDYVFGFRLKFAINKFDKSEIIKAADSTLLYNPAGKNQFIFLENHDTRRFASEDNMTLPKAKAAAAIQILIGGIPSLYYGQEVGMKGIQQSFGMTDGNDIPVREAFDWYADGGGAGMARWYKDTGPWWTQRTERANDGISFEEQDKDQTSLLNYYRALLQLRKEHRALQEGSYRSADNNNPSVLTFHRSDDVNSLLIAINLSDKIQPWSVTGVNKEVKIIFGNKTIIRSEKEVGSILSPYEVIVLSVDK